MGLLDPAHNYLPEDVSTIHIMGVCGTGMAALAAMLKQSGYIITGSDSHVYPPMSDYLQQIGIAPQDGYAAENLSHSPDLVIVGNVITAKNSEAINLAERNLPYLSFPQALAEIFIAGKKSIVITGTHGKTTTCSLLATSLYHAGRDPSFMIGGIVKEFNSNNRIGNDSLFITEGDEYDTAFFDKESKFLHYRPDIAVLSSIEFDHADIFHDLEQIKASFKKFVRCLSKDGLIIANLDDSDVAEVVSEASCKVEGYGFSNKNTWRIREISPHSSFTSFSYTHEDNEHIVQFPLSGSHNCFNGIAVIAVMNHLGIDHDTASSSLKKFSGVKRRQEIRGIVDSITVIDDFAHHPTAVNETLLGLKSMYSGQRLIAVFEPRTNSSRRTVFQKKYANSFGGADVVLIRAPLPLTTISEDQLFSSAQLANDLEDKGKHSRSFSDTDEILKYLKTLLEPGDIVAILSNGGFDNIHERLLEMLRQR